MPVGSKSRSDAVSLPEQAGCQSGDRGPIPETE